MKLLTLPCLARTHVRFLVDNNPILRGKTLAGSPVVGPQEIAGTREPIIIATLLHADEISAQIRRLGLSNPVLSLLPPSKTRGRMKLSDYIVGQLADWGVRHIFLVTGGGAMHLNDSIGKEPRIHYICNHHEQASAMAAEAYARISGQPGVVNVTTGPGGINALNGVFGAWTDSIPMLVVSGQVKRETCMRAQGLTGLRQLGDQEIDIVAMVGEHHQVRGDDR